jgi:hypothetical protein
MMFLLPAVPACPEIVFEPTCEFDRMTICAAAVPPSAMNSAT